jgi:hypothetical protein
MLHREAACPCRPINEKRFVYVISEEEIKTESIVVFVNATVYNITPSVTVETLEFTIVFLFFNVQSCVVSLAKIIIGEKGDTEDS